MWELDAGLSQLESRALQVQAQGARKVASESRAGARQLQLQQESTICAGDEGKSDIVVNVAALMPRTLSAVGRRRVSGLDCPLPTLYDLQKLGARHVYVCEHF